MRRTYLPFLLIVSFILARTLWAATPTLSMTGLSNPAPASVVDVMVLVADASDLTAYEFDLQYDPTYLVYAEFVASDHLAPTTNCDPDTTRCTVTLTPITDTQHIEIGAYSYGTGSGASGDGALGTVRFLTTSAQGKTTLSIANAQFADGNGNPSIPDTQPFDLTVGVPTATTLAQNETQRDPIGASTIVLLAIVLILMTAVLREKRLLILLVLLVPLGAYAEINPDLNSDNEIDIYDIMSVVVNWNTANATYDFDTSGLVEKNDIDVIGDRWHQRGAYLSESSPAQSERDVAVTRETILTFAEPIDPTDISDMTVYAMFSGELLDKRLHISPDNRTVTLFYDRPLPASATVQVFINGDTIFDTNGYALDANNDGKPGGLGVIAFDTLSLTALDGTAICGRVIASELGADSNGQPIDMPLEGATITVDGKESELFATTDTDGDFCLDPAPAGRFFVHIDGRTATNNTQRIAEGAYYPFVGKPYTSKIGQTIDIGTVHLPLVQPNTLQPVSQSNDTVIHFAQSVLDDYPEFADVTITVPADSLYANDGTRGGMVGIAPVPPDRLPGTLPPDLDFPLVITVQTNGATNFDIPAPVCFPNLPDPDTGVPMPAGTETGLWSFDHDIGTWLPAGAAVVSADASLVCTVAGAGVSAPGWHGVERRSNLENPMCEELGWGDMWDMVKAGKECLGRRFPLAQRAIDLAGAVYDSAVSLFAAADTAKTRYDNGGYNNISELTSDINQVRGTASTLKDAATTLASATPIGAAVGALDCAASIGGVLADKLCKTLRCESETLDSLCSLKDALSDKLGTALDEFGKWADGVLGAESADSIDQMAQELADYVDNMDDPYPGGNPDPYVAATLGSIADSADGIQEGLSNNDAFSTAMDELGGILGNVIGKAQGTLSQPGAFGGKWACLSVGEFDPFWCGYWHTMRWRVPAERGFRIEIYNHRDQALLQSSGVTEKPGKTLKIPEGGYNLSFYDPDAPDADGDGIPDAAEELIGTSVTVFDSDNDGVGDGTELDNGTNPTDGLFEFGQGVIGSVDLPNEARDVCALNDLVAVALGASGVAMIEPRGFENPVISGIVNTGGSATQVACGKDMIAVADGGLGLTVIDTTIPAESAVSHVVRLPHTALSVEIIGRIAYVGTSNGNLWLVDLDSGIILDSLTLPEKIVDLQVFEDALYALTPTELHTLSLPLSLEHSQTPPGSGNNTRLFAGGDELFTTYVNGWNRYSLSDPLAPSHVQQNDTAQFGWKQIISNGSGLGLAPVGANASVNSGDHDLDLYNIGGNNGLVNILQTPGSARAVAIYNGFGFVADHRAGVQVVNYLATDTLGIAPAVTLTTNFPVGLAEEGKLLRLSAETTDDIQLRNVDFYIDGELALRDGNFPFEHRLVTPLAGLQPTMTIEARAYDTGGNNTWSGTQTLTLVPDATAPEVGDTSPSDGAGVQEETIDTLGVFFSEPIDFTSVKTTTLALVEAGVDTAFGTLDDVPFTITSVANDALLQASFATLTGTLPAGSYQAVISDTVRDLAGNRLAAPFVWTFEVKAPVRWTNPSGGNWNAGGNWSTGVAPSADDVVVIDLPGSFNISTSGNITVKSVHIVNPDVSIRHGSATFTVLDDYINTGKINVDSASISATTARLTVGGTLINNGEIEINVGGNREGSRRIRADILNNGLIDINHRAFFEKDGGELINAGVIDINDGDDLWFDGDLATFNNEGGTIQNTGELEIRDGSTINLTTGVVTGTLITAYGGEVYLSNELAATNATVQLRTSPTIYGGDIPAGLTVNFYWTTITIPNGFTNRGTLNLGLNLSGGDPATHVDLLAGALVNRGTMTTRGDASRVTVSADLTNHGLIDVNSDFTLDLAGSTFRNVGTLDVGGDATLNGTSATFHNDGGTLQNTGTLYIRNDTTTVLTTGVISDSTVNVRGGVVEISDSLIAQNARVVMHDDPITVTGEIPVGMTAEMYWTTITAPNGLTNNGTLILGLNTFGTDPLTNVDLLAGEISNHGTMLMRGDDGRVTVSADLTNHGLIDVNSNFTLDLPNSTFRNAGVLDVGGSPTLNGANATYLHDGGTLQNNAGILNIRNGATAILATGIISDATVSVRGADVVFSSTLTAINATVLMHNDPITVTGEIPSGMTAEMYWTTITAPNGLTNNGTLILGLNTFGADPLTNVDLLAGEISNHGTIRTRGDNDRVRLSADLVNNGTLAVNSSFLFNDATTSLTNNGVINLATNRKLDIGAASFVNVVGGTIAGDGELDVDSTTAAIHAGTLAPGSSAGKLTVRGTLPLSPTANIAIEIGGITRTVAYDWLAVTGSATLTGTLDITLINGYEPEIGDTFTIVTCGSCVGAFETINGVEIGNGKRFDTVYNGGDIQLVVVTVALSRMSILDHDS